MSSTNKTGAVAFATTKCPNLRVLIRRGDGSLGGDRFAQFKKGFCITDDPDTIAVLQRAVDVYECDLDEVE